MAEGGDPEASVSTEYEYDTDAWKEVSQAGMWSVSSCKAGYGVESVVDGSTETYWQSDGPQPHLLSVSFRRKTPLAAVAIYVDFKADESYTPSRISVRAGSGPGQLRELALWTLAQEPVGWHTRTLEGPNGGAPTPAFLLQFAVLQNHQNGRDTHIRQRQGTLDLAASLEEGVDEGGEGGALAGEVCEELVGVSRPLGRILPVKVFSPLAGPARSLPRAAAEEEAGEAAAESPEAEVRGLLGASARFTTRDWQQFATIR